MPSVFGEILKVFLLYKLRTSQIIMRLRLQALQVTRGPQVMLVLCEYVFKNPPLKAWPPKTALSLATESLPPPNFNLPSENLPREARHPHTTSAVVPTHPTQSGCTTRSISAERRRSGPAGSADTCPPPAARSNWPGCWTGRKPRLTCTPSREDTTKQSDLTASRFRSRWLVKNFFSSVKEEDDT